MLRAVSHAVSHAAPASAVDWQELLLDFLQTEHAETLLGAASDLRLVVRRGKPLDHLVILTALRVLLEMAQTARFERFVASLGGPRVCDARAPRFTRRDPLDDYSRCTPNAKADYVCLGCQTPRILLHNLRCGKCEMLATVSTAEYLAMFKLNRGRLFERES